MTSTLPIQSLGMLSGHPVQTGLFAGRLGTAASGVLAVVTPQESAVYTSNVIASNPQGIINTQEAINFHYNERIVALEPQIKALAAASDKPDAEPGASSGH